MTTANKITLARMMLIPIFMYSAISEGAQGNFVALALFAIASLTDGIDAVSYTHLDVYKRQHYLNAEGCPQNIYVSWSRA